MIFSKNELHIILKRRNLEICEHSREILTSLPLKRIRPEFYLFFLNIILVNARLAGDDTEDPKFPKIQFPSAEDCPKCRNDEGNFEESEILDFMKSRYSLENCVFFENEKIIESNSERLEDDEDEEEIISPSKSR